MDPLASSHINALHANLSNVPYQGKMRAQTKADVENKSIGYEL